MSLNVAIVGCGKIADAHAEQIRRIKECALVAACDREELMARQLAERFEARRSFDNLDQLLDEARPDVVHITTPPQSHYTIARQCLEHGCHVYVEKPFTLNAREAEVLVELAERRGLRLTVGHHFQFSHAARRVRSLIRQGYLGDEVVHMESQYGYDLGDPAYARAFLGDGAHWVRTLPGGLLQNVISHGIARIAELLTGEHPRVVAHGFVSPPLRRLGGEDVVDELRATIVDERGTTAYFTFSSQMRPVLHQFRVYGSRNGLMLDELQQTVLKLRGQAFKSYLEQFVPPIIFAKQYMTNAAHNMRLFLANDFHMEAGKRELMTAFYRSIVDGTAPPIPSGEILRTARLMDSIFEQVSIPSRAATPRPEGQASDGEGDHRREARGAI
jgi:predicted dehydrogenase